MAEANSSMRPGLSAVEYRASLPVGNMDKNIIIVTASLLGLLILTLCTLCVVELARKRSAASRAASSTSKPAQAPTGMNKLQLGALPSCLFGSSSPHVDGKLAQHATPAASSVMCAICLSDFAVGDRIRLLPPCQHRFHVGCIDQWLSLHSSCPSCREDLQLSAPAAAGLLNIVIRT